MFRWLSKVAWRPKAKRWAAGLVDASRSASLLWGSEEGSAEPAAGGERVQVGETDLETLKAVEALAAEFTRSYTDPESDERFSPAEVRRMAEAAAAAEVAEPSSSSSEEGEGGGLSDVD